MRKLAGALRVEAMSLYKHVADKGAVLDGLVDLVAAEIGLPLATSGWRTALRHHAIATRRVCLRHRWAAVLLESRGATAPSRMRYADALLGLLRGTGFTVPLAYRAFLLVDSYLYGFVMQEAHFPSDEGETTQRAALMESQLPQAEYPALTEAMSHIMAAGPRAKELYDAEFEHGLELILDGLERLRRDAGSSSSGSGVDGVAPPSRRR